MCYFLFCLGLSLCFGLSCTCPWHVEGGLFRFVMAVVLVRHVMLWSVMSFQVVLVKNGSFKA